MEHESRSAAAPSVGDNVASPTRSTASSTGSPNSHKNSPPHHFPNDGRSYSAGDAEPLLYAHKLFYNPAEAGEERKFTRQKSADNDTAHSHSHSRPSRRFSREERSQRRSSASRQHHQMRDDGSVFGAADSEQQQQSRGAPRSFWDHYERTAESVNADDSSSTSSRSKGSFRERTPKSEWSNQAFFMF